MMPLAAAFALLFLLTAVVMRRPAAEKGLPRPPPVERRSSLFLGLAHGVSMLAGIASIFLTVGRLPVAEPFAWGAVLVQALAFGLQIWSMRTLGPLFTTDLRAEENQELVQRGPYRVVRHPGYLAQLVFWLAFACATRNALVIALVLAVDLAAYVNRIRTEERMLAEALGERFRAYARGRARLVPGVW